MTGTRPSEANGIGGQLAIIGTGYRSIGDVTLEGSASLEQADKVFFLVADPVTAKWIRDRNSTAENLHPLYTQGKERRQTYSEMVEKILGSVRQGKFVTAAFYGHPGVFAFPPHEAIRRARAEGFSARMLPAVSAEDWIFADLGMDPAESGCQSFEATDFLVNRRMFDPTSLLVLWQVGVIGALDFQWRYEYGENWKVLIGELLEQYPRDHQVAVYQISPYVICDPHIEWSRMDELSGLEVTPSSTLIIPPRARRISDEAMLKRLGMPTRSDGYRIVVASDGLGGSTGEVPL